MHLAFVVISALGIFRTSGSASGLWSRWSECSKQCFEQLRIRSCGKNCSKSTVQIRSCAARNCSALAVRSQNFPFYPSMRRIEIMVNNSWRPFCHSAWGPGLADAICKKFYKTIAEASLVGPRVVEKPTVCQANLSGIPCGSVGDPLKDCEKSSQAGVVCQANVSLAGGELASSGTVKFFNDSVSSSVKISIRGWDMRDAVVVCRHLGFESALAPFSTEISEKYTLSSVSVTNFSCNGNETKLVYCPYTLHQTSSPAATVTCKPVTFQNQPANFVFRRPVQAKGIGEKFNISCRITNDIPTGWYRINGKKILAKDGRVIKQGSSSRELLLIFNKMTTKDAGVYVCKGYKKQGIYVLYVLAQISAPHYSQEIQVKSSAFVRSCNVSGNPLPSVTVLQDGHPLDQPRVKYLEDEDNQGGLIIIQSVLMQDSGIYTCLVTQVFEDGQIVSNESFVVYVKEKDKEGPNINLRSGGPSSASSTSLIASLVSLAVLLLIIFIAGGFVYYRRRPGFPFFSTKRNVLQWKFASESDQEEMEYFATSEWEIHSSQLYLRELIGSGAFGEVWKATLSHPKDTHRNQRIVAVKKLKTNSSAAEKHSLKQEIELGKSLNGDTHRHIMNFIGCVTTSSHAPLMLVMEYVPYGDLLGYLRKSRGIDDRYYNCKEDCMEEVTSYDMLSFSQQIASGMSFLADRKILHRDLAARNVLLGEGKICKITDFGLALIRDKYHYIYCTAIKQGRLPVKWTAPEHLFDDRNERVSEKSDVWSFGIVLYEIFTLGGVPYPKWNEWKVVYELKVSKYRMPKPDHISNEIYDVMMECWDEDPSSRPSFERLYQEITEMLEKGHYIELDMTKYQGDLYETIDDICRVTSGEPLEPAVPSIGKQTEELSES